MKDKEMIEEMAKRDKLIDVLLKAHRECRFLEQEQPYPCEGCKYRTLDRSIRGCIFDRYADAIIESGIFCDNSKLPEDSVVMSKEEYKKYCAYKIIEPQIRGCLDRERELEKQLQQSHKETAERDFNHIIKALEIKKASIITHYGVKESVGADIAIRTVKELAKQFGVEVEE